MDPAFFAGILNVDFEKFRDLREIILNSARVVPHEELLKIQYKVILLDVYNNRWE